MTLAEIRAWLDWIVAHPYATQEQRKAAADQILSQENSSAEDEAFLAEVGIKL